MVATIAGALAQVKEDLPRMIERHVVAYLSEHNQWDWRQRLLDPLTTTLLFTTQVMHGNTAINHLRHLSGMKFTATAYCNARRRLPLGLLQQVSQGVTRELLPTSDDQFRWRGHRVWKADATSLSMPDTPELQQHFGQPARQRPGCGFPVATLMTLSNPEGFIAKVLPLPWASAEPPHIPRLHEQLEPGDVLIYDRAASSYTQLALLSRRNLHAIFRMHQKRIVSFRRRRRHAKRFKLKHRVGKPKSQWLCRLGKHDQLVRYFKPKDKPRWMSRQEYDALPPSLVVRELRYQVHRRGCRSQTITLVTTLLHPDQHPARELAEQYLLRWGIELDFRHLKITMGMEVLKCRTVEGVLKELEVFVLVYNLVRLLILRASERQRAPLSSISFVDALRRICDARTGDELIDLIVNPRRPGRLEPRVLKRRSKPFPVMTKPRHVLRQTLLTPRIAA